MEYRQGSIMAFCIRGSPDVLTGSGAVSLDAYITHIVTGGVGADAITLDDGYEGQNIFIVLKTLSNGGDTSVLTPAHPLGYNTITFNSANDCGLFCFTNSGWYCVGVHGAVIG